MYCMGKIALKRSEFYKKSGIYCIAHESGKSYVGSSINIYDRVCAHRRKLVNNEHENEHLQNAFNKHGEESFAVELLEECNSSELAKRETRWIEQRNCMCKEYGYNKSFVSISRKNKYTRDSRIKMSKSHMGNKKVLMLSKEDEESVKEFNSLYEAAEYIKESDQSKSSEFFIKQKISQASKGSVVSTGNNRFAKRSSAYGYIWRIQ